MNISSKFSSWLNLGPVEPPATASPASGPGKYQHPNAKNAALGLGGSGGIDRRRGM